MKNLTYLFMILLVCLTIVSPAQPGSAQDQAPAPVEIGSSAGTALNLFLPFVGSGKPLPAQKPPSDQLIDEAVEAGTLTAEQGLIYKVFAIFGDPRLPAQYQGSSVGRAGDQIMREVVYQSATLSAQAHQTLAPFFVPPSLPGSWYALQHPAKTAGDPASFTNSSLHFVETVKGQFRIWYSDDLPGSQEKAEGLKAEFDKKIYDKLVPIIGHEPWADSSWHFNIYLSLEWKDSDGTAVVFDAKTLGVAVPQSTCANTSVVVYLPYNQPLGDETNKGLLQYATHEFMHALLFRFDLAACRPYDWLHEATATWAEDHVYPHANSEWPVVNDYLSRPNVRLDDMKDLHEYGAYLLPYYLTHQIANPSIIKTIWENGAKYQNSFTAIDQAVPQAQRSMYWPQYLVSLWNKEPFQEYYKTADKLTQSVKPAESEPTLLTTNGQEEIVPLYGELPVGAAIYYHFKFDDSVRSVAVMNGLGKTLTTGPASEHVDSYVADDDEIYYIEDEEDVFAGVEGATLVVMMKVAGVGWQFKVLSSRLAHLSQYAHCMDSQGKVEEMVIILSSQDFANPDKIMKPAGLPVSVIANDLPCWKLTGTSKITDFNHGVTRTTQATYTYSYPSAFQNMGPYDHNIFVYPETILSQIDAHINWNISGTDVVGCTYSGSGSYSMGEITYGGGHNFWLLNGILVGSPSYRAYHAEGAPIDSSPDMEYSFICPDGSGTGTDSAPSYLDIPLTDDYRGQFTWGSSSSISDTYQVDGYGNDYLLYEWSLNAHIK